jgi:hypothetical protein
VVREELCTMLLDRAEQRRKTAINTVVGMWS